MFQSASRRWLVLGGLLLATVVASVWPQGGESPALEIVAPSERGDAAAPRNGRAQSGQTVTATAELPPLGERLERSQGATKVENLFGAMSWIPPAKPVAATPVAPPFPYTVAGSLIDNGVPTVVFMKQNQYFILRVMEVLESTYRIDAIDERSIALTYLPLGHRQTLPLGTLK